MHKRSPQMASDTRRSTKPAPTGTSAVWPQPRRPSAAHCGHRTIQSSRRGQYGKDATSPTTDVREHRTRDAHEALAFVLKWRYWGGGEDEDIFVHFGLDTCQYFQRVRKLLSTPAAAGLSADEKADLRRICSTRLQDGEDAGA